jgi:hypothetical protein
MSIEATDYGMEVSCDFCDAEFELQIHSIPLAAQAAKKRGWRIFQENGEWRTRCPNCLREWAQQGAARDAR